MSILKDLKIKESNYDFLDEDNEKLQGLSQVNIFIGENNSGKSRFLRSIFYKDDLKLEFVPNDEKYEYYISQMEKAKIEMEKRIKNVKTPQKSKIEYNSLNPQMHLDKYITESISPCESFNELYNKNTNPHDARIKLLNEYFEEIDFLDKNLFKYDFHKIYIPSLRGLLPFIPDKTISTSYTKSEHINKFVPEDTYGQRTKNDYFGDDPNILLDVTDSLMKQVRNTNNYIITGHYFYKYVQEFLLGNLQQREIIKEYQEYLSKNFFQNQEVTLIPKLEDDVLTVKIGDEEEQKIYDLGEGIQSIILITLPLFLYLDESNKENTNILIFIEEPEIGLHPKLQRILLETLLNERFENYQFFFTTHSNHFIDRKYEDEKISIYSFDKYLDSEKGTTTKFNIEKVGFDHLPTLQKLGALPSSVLGSNCTILVEGSYDVVHYNFYLKLYQEKLKKDNDNLKIFKKGIDYSFLRGGGKEIFNTIEEFNSIEKERIFTILDFDSKRESEKHIALFEKIEYNNYKILDVKEVENLISKPILIKMLESFREIRKLGMNEDFDENEYKKSNFYKFIKNKIITREIPDNFFNEDTFKERFSYKEQEFTETFDELTEDAQNITKEIYKFIEKNN